MAANGRLQPLTWMYTQGLVLTPKQPLTNRQEGRGRNVEVKAFGYTAAGEASSLPAELREVTIIAGPNELRRIADFLRDAADAIETHKEDFDHEHLRDVLPDWSEESTDIIVSQAS